MSTKVELNPISVIKTDLGLQPNGDVHKFFTHTCRIYMDKYVPLDSGWLRTNVEEGPDYIAYNSPYAHYQYIGELYVDPETGSSWAKKDATKISTGIPLNYNEPGTGPYWDQRMWSAEGRDIVKDVQAYVDRGGK